MYYYGKESKVRWSEFSKSAKNIFIGGNQSVMPKSDVNNHEKGEQKVGSKFPSQVEVSVTTPVIQVATQQTEAITPLDLQQAIIWSEILGKPVSKRRERRYYGN